MSPMGQSCSVETPPGSTFASDSYIDTVENRAQERNVLPSAVVPGSVLDVATSRYSAPRTVYCSSDIKCLARLDWPLAAANPSKAQAQTQAKQPVLFNGHTKAVNRLFVDGKRGHIWSVSRDLSVKQWLASNDDNTASGECLQTFSDAHELNLTAVAMDEEGNGEYVYTGSRDYSVKQWDVSAGKCVTTFAQPRNIVTALNVGSTGHGISAGLLYQASEDLKVRVWDPRVGGTSSHAQPAAELTGFVYFALCMDIHSNGFNLATGCKGFNSVGCEMKLGDLRYPTKPVCEGRRHSQDVTACKFIESTSTTRSSSSSSSSLCASCCKDGSVRLWDVNSGGELLEEVAMLSTSKYVYMYMNVCVCFCVCSSPALLPPTLTNSSPLFFYTKGTTRPSRGCGRRRRRRGSQIARR